MPRPTPWTPEDLADLQRLTAKRVRNRSFNWKAIFKRFPHRTKAAVYKQMRVNGWTDPALWTPEEDQVLLDGWNDQSMRLMRQALPNRTRQAIYERAHTLGLRAGPPQGMVSVKSLSDDPSWGYDYYKNLRILKFASVQVRRFSYAGKRDGVRYVDIDDARDAAVAWERHIADERVGKETTKEAAKRIGVRENTLRAWVTLEGLLPPSDPSTKRRFFALPELFDRIAAKYQSPAERMPAERSSMRTLGTPPPATSTIPPA